ncbi:MAG: FAD-dependent oxidoreductase [Crocinitomicaceae bacterium]
MKKKVVILGGGVIGMFSAYYLAKAGHSVTVLDKGALNGVSSTGNAGMIVPSHVIPLAAPGMISKGIRWMFDSKSPFYVKPRLNSELLHWGWNFYRSANQKHVDDSKIALRDLSLLSKQLYQELSATANDFEFEEKGLLMLFQSEKVGEEERAAGAIARDLGLDVDILDRAALQELDYGIQTNAEGAVLYKGDAHLHPNKLFAFLREELGRQNVSFVEQVEINRIEKHAGSIKAIHTEKATYEADAFVIAAGAWSAALAKLAGDSIQLLPGKGYSFTLEKPDCAPKIPTILCEGKVAVTAFHDQIRFGGTMEITHTRDQAINMKRVEGIVNTVHRFYPEMDFEPPQKEDVWMGYRPCSPTGLPYIGRSPKISNLIFATGHGMMGLSLGAATGKIVEEIVGGEMTSVDATLFQLKA